MECIKFTVLNLFLYLCEEKYNFYHFLKHFDSYTNMVPQFSSSLELVPETRTINNSIYTSFLCIAFTALYSQYGHVFLSLNVNILSWQLKQIEHLATKPVVGMWQHCWISLAKSLRNTGICKHWQTLVARRSCHTAHQSVVSSNVW